MSDRECCDTYLSTSWHTRSFFIQYYDTCLMVRWEIGFKLSKEYILYVVYDIMCLSVYIYCVCVHSFTATNAAPTAIK